MGLFRRGGSPWLPPMVQPPGPEQAAMLAQLNPPENSTELQGKLLEPTSQFLNPLILRDLGTANITKAEQEEIDYRLGIAVKLWNMGEPMLAMNIVSKIYTQLNLSRSVGGFLIRALHHRGFTVANVPAEYYAGGGEPPRRPPPGRR